MKKILIATTAAVLILSAAPSNALVVSDPGQYARMATQLQELKKHFDALKAQLEELQNIQKSVTGNLKRGKGIFRDLGKLQDLSEKMTEGLHSLPHMDLDDYDLENIEDTKEVLDQIYGNEVGVFERAQTEKQRQEYQQRAIKAALEGSEVLIALQQERFQKVAELANEIDQTQTLKDALDLNNRMLGEILLVQQTALLLQAQYVRANQALKYTHADSGQAEDDPNKNESDSFLRKSGERFSKKMQKQIEENQWDAPPF